MTTTIAELPASTLTRKQVKTFRKNYGDNVIVAEVRHDDECGNGHNSFAITATIFTRKRYPGETTTTNSKGQTVWASSGGCLHDEVANHFPGLAPLIKWHLTSIDGPMHYIANTIYQAGERDYNGLLKGEFRQHISRGSIQNRGVEGVPNWVLKLPAQTDIYSHKKPQAVTLEWQPYGRTGEGKERDLNAARNSAVWPDATDEELTAPDLKERLMARLPALMEEFKRDVESLGFTY